MSQVTVPEIGAPDAGPLMVAVADIDVPIAAFGGEAPTLTVVAPLDTDN
jgi:hypothetical protein